MSRSLDKVSSTLYGNIISRKNLSLIHKISDWEENIVISSLISILYLKILLFM